MSSKPLFCKEYGAKIEQAAEVLTHRDGSNQSEPVRRSETMANAVNIPILSEKSTQNNSSTWKPIGPLAAALALAIAARVGAK